MVNEKPFSPNTMHMPMKLRNPSTSKLYLKLLKGTKYNTGAAIYRQETAIKYIVFCRHFLLLKTKFHWVSLMLLPYQKPWSEYMLSAHPH
jgi:hypothetical protein